MADALAAAPASARTSCRRPSRRCTTRRRSTATTDWPQILALYDLLEQVGPKLRGALNHAVALGMVKGPREGLRLLEPLEQDRWMAESHRLSAVRAYLLERDGDLDGALEAYRTAAAQAASGPERRFLAEQVERVAGVMAAGSEG